MSKTLGFIKNIIGTVSVKHADGTLEVLLNNAVIVEGDTVVNMKPNSATIVLNNGREVPVEGDSFTVVDMTVGNAVAKTDASADGEDIDLALVDNVDDIKTAAGDEESDGSYFPSEYTERTGASQEIDAQSSSSGHNYNGGQINDYRTDEETLAGLGRSASADGGDTFSGLANLFVSVSTDFPGGITTSSARSGTLAPSRVTSDVSDVSDVFESQGEVYVSLTSDHAFDYDTVLHFDFVSGEGLAEWADDYTFPMQYTTDGGATWTDMVNFNVTMDAGATNLVLRVNIFDDGVVENTEQFLANVSSDDFNPAEVDFNIHDNDIDDGTPLMSVDFAYVVEGMEYAEYHITLDKPAEGEVSINYYTSDFGAVAGEDYVGVSGTAVFVDGQTEVVVRVPIIDDTLVEGTELAFFNLDPDSLSGHVKLADIQGSLRIFDNDGEANSDIAVSLDAITADNTINSTEAGSSVNVTGNVSGVALANGVVVLSVNGETFSGTLNSDGSFNIAVDGSALAQDGDTTIETAVYAEDTTGTYQRATTTGSYEVDIVAPDAPTITLDTDSGTTALITNDGAYTVTPSEETSKVEYSLDGGETWSEEAPVADTDGAYVISVRETDIAGNVSPTAVLEFTLDTTAPDAPEVALANDTLGADLITNDATLAVTPNEETSSIEYSIDGGETWTTEAPEATEGENSVSVREVDGAGNTSVPASITFTLDTTAPDAPEITNIVDTNGDFTAVTLYGRGSEVGNVVTLYDSGVVVGTAVVGEDLTWSVDVTDVPKSGNETLSATESDMSGNESATSTAVNYAHNDWSNSVADASDDYVFKGEGDDTTRFAVDDANNKYVYDGGQGKDTLSFEGNENNISADLATGIALSGNDTLEIRNTENLIGSSNDDNLSGDTGSNTLSGGEGNDTIHAGDGDDVLVGGKGNDSLFGGAGDDTLIAGDGDEDIILGGAGDDTIIYEGAPEDYTVTLNPDGTYNVEDSEGNVDVVDEVENITFKDGDAPDTTVSLVNGSTIETPSVDLIDNSDTGVNNSDSITSDNTPTIRVSIGDGAVIGNVINIYVDGSVVTSNTITVAQIVDGFVDIELPELVDGSYDITANIDGANASSAMSGSEHVVIDTAIDSGTSDEPITAQLDDASNSGTNDDTLTNDNTPTISGKTEAGTVVEALDAEGNVLGSSVADENGHYEITTTPLDDGDNPLTIRVSDDAGNSATTTIDVIVDTLATSAPTIHIGNDDGNITRTELDENGDVRVHIEMPADVVIGDTLSVTGPDGVVTPIEVTQDIIDNGYGTSYPTPDKGESLAVSANVTDQAGNTSINGETSGVVQTDPNTNILLEESFENLQTSHGWHVETGDVIGDHGTIWNTGTNGIEVQRGIVSGSSDGAVHAELDAHHNVTMTAMVALTDSSDYTLAFDVKPRDGGASRDFKDTSDMKITVGDIEVAVNSDVNGNLTFETNDDSVVVKSFINPDTGWNTVIIEYADLEGTTLPVTVEGTGSDDSYGMLLDNMSMLDATGEYGHAPVVPVVNTNVAPEATAETADVTEDMVITGQIDASDANGDILTFAIAEGATVPTGLIVNSDGSYRFDAGSYDELSAGEIETLAAVPIVVTDGHGGVTETTLTVDVSGVNNDLTYVSETAGYSNVVGYYEVDANGVPLSPVVVSIDNQNGLPSGLHLNDLNPNTSYGFFIVANGANEVNENSTLTFDTTGAQPVLLIDGEPSSHRVYHDTPEFNFDGKDHFVFDSDGNGGTNILIEDLPFLGDADFRDVVLNVNFEMADKIGDDVRVYNDSVATVEDTEIVIDANTLLANDKDATGDTLEIIGVETTSNTHGTVTLDADGNVIYTPEAGFNGNASFNYTASDSNVGSGTGRVNVHVSELPEITNIVDVASDYSQVILSGTGEPGATITLFNKSGSTTNGNATNLDGVDTEIFPSATVDSDGTWSIDISNLTDTPLNDNEFFTATQLDSYGNEAHTQGSVHYWHGTWGSASTEVADDYVMMGNGDDRLNIRADDANNALVVDGGNGNDKAIFNGKFSDFTIASVGGNIIVKEPNGDVNELRNFEHIGFNNAVLNVATMQVVQTSNDISSLGDIGDNNSGGENPSEIETFNYAFGESLAGQTVTLSFNSEAVGTWDQAPATSDVFTVSANGDELVERRYDHTTDDDNTWNETHSFDVVLDEDGKANVTFDVATTGTDEKVSFSDIQVTYDANDTFVYDGTAIDAGFGEDILVMNDTLDIDFDALAANVDNVEVLDVNSVANLTNINAKDIVDLTDDDNILEIHSSDTTNALTLDSNEWSVGTNTVDYNEFVSTVNDETVTLRVENTIIVDNN